MVNEEKHVKDSHLNPASGRREKRFWGDSQSRAGTNCDASPNESLSLAKELFASKIHQARMLAIFLWGYLLVQSWR
jgi:hypothetical protein